MNKKYFFLLFLTVITVYGKAQSKKDIYRFHSINSVGLANGSNAVSALLQSVNGFQKGPVFAGLGVGLDYYLYRTVPVFADIRYELGKKKNKFFVYADGGINFNWVQDYFYIEPFIRNGNSSNDFHNGLYTDAGWGYLIGMKKGNALVLSLGYSHKRLKELTSYQDWRTNEWQTNISSYHLNRILLKAGWRF